MKRTPEIISVAFAMATSVIAADPQTPLASGPRTNLPAKVISFCADKSELNLNG
jgi:hypothetical protein